MMKKAVHHLLCSNFGQKKSHESTGPVFGPAFMAIMQWMVPLF